MSAARSPSQEVRSRMAADLARQLDEKLREAIESRIGAIERVEDLRGRLARVTRVGTAIEAWSLDGVLLLEVWPAEFRQDGNHLAATQQVRVHPGGPAS